MLTGILSGVAGEYFVAAELSRRGYIASITLRNSKGVDILCSNAEAARTVAIQVKTVKGSGQKWLLSEKCEDYHAENLFYVKNGDGSNFMSLAQDDWTNSPVGPHGFRRPVSGLAV